MKKKPKLICCGNARPDLMANFYLYHINLTSLFSDIFSDGINGQT